MAEIIIPTDNTLILPSDDRTREVPSIVTDDELTLRKFQLLRLFFLCPCHKALKLDFLF